MQTNPQQKPSAQYQLQLSEIISALSYALDLTEGQPPGHCIRCCWIGFHIGKEYGLAQDDLWDLYYTLLLKDAGCSSNAARLCELYGSDDRIAKRDFKTVNSDSVTQLVKYVISHTGMRNSLADQFKRVFTIARKGEEISTSLIKTRCERGAAIARKLNFNESVARGIHSLDEHWNGNGKPQKLSQNAIPIHSRIALLSQVIDVFFQMGGRAAALMEARNRSGTWFDPALISIVNKLGDTHSNNSAHNKVFWKTLQDPDIEKAVQALEPQSRSLLVNDDLLDQISEAFGQVIDAKSPYTAGHSSRVAAYTDTIAIKMGLDETRRRWLRRGALLHDLGKLGVSNAILDKKGKLNEQEWQEVRMHPVYTEQILARIRPFQELATVSSAHHERLDGKGYPKQLGEKDISLETRIITLSDIFDAITADRPYRGPIPIPEAMQIMQRMVGNALDADCYQALVESLDEIIEAGDICHSSNPDNI